MLVAAVFQGPDVVALLAEGVDRNSRRPDPMTFVRQSPSSRRAWIEILQDLCNVPAIDVALLAEGVDRNRLAFVQCPL